MTTHDAPFPEQTAQPIPCAIPGCPNPAEPRRNPPTCDPCHRLEREASLRPRPCHYCSRRRKCVLDPSGRIRCHGCELDHHEAERDQTRRSHSHSIDHARLYFSPAGVPISLHATTHCGWSHTANLEMVDGRAAYILTTDPPTPLLYDPEAATCILCRNTARLRERNRAAAATARADPPPEAPRAT